MSFTGSSRWALVLSRHYPCPRLVCSDVLRLEETDPRSEGCYQIQNASSIAVLPTNCTVTIFTDPYCNTPMDQLSVIHGSGDYPTKCFALDKDPANVQGSFNVSCPGDNAWLNQSVYPGEVLTGSLIALENSSYNNDADQELQSDTDNSIEASSKLEIETTLWGRSSTIDDVEWELLFWGLSCCPVTFPGADFALRSEFTDPWRDGCQRFINFTSVNVKSDECTIRFFQDDSCTMLLDGENSVFPPNITEESTRRSPCLNLSLNETEKNRGCTLDDDGRFDGDWNFSGSWKVECPNDLASLDATVAQRGLLQDLSRTEGPSGTGLSLLDDFTVAKQLEINAAIFTDEQYLDADHITTQDLEQIWEPFVEEMGDGGVSLASPRLHPEPLRSADWSIWMVGASCCPVLDLGFEEFNEDTSPWREGCHAFARKASASVYPSPCTIHFFQDDDCTKLLDGNSSVITEDTCVHLTLDPVFKNETQLCHGPGSKPLEYWHFNGSFTVTCPEDSRNTGPLLDTVH